MAVSEPISKLPPLSVADATDLIPVVDVSAGVTKRTTVGSLAVYNQGGIDAIDRSVEGKLQETVSVTDFKNSNGSQVVFDDSTDNLTGIQAAIDDAPANGRKIECPEGVGRISGKLSILANGIHLVGAGERATFLRTTSATLDMIEIGDGTAIPIDCSVEGMTMDASVTRSGGRCIVVENGHNIQLSRLKFNAPFIALQFLGGASQFLYYLNQFEISNSVSDSIRLGVAAGSAVTDVWLTRGIISASGGSGILGLNCSGVYSSDIDIITSADSGVATFPAAGDKCKAMFFTRVLCDTGVKNGWNFITNGGSVSEITLTNCWGSTNGSGGSGSGLRIDEGSGTVDGVILSASRFTNNDDHGIILSAGTNISIADTQCLSNSQGGSGVSHGLKVDAGVSNWTVSGGVYGLGGAITSNLQDFGILIAVGGSDNFSIIGTDCTGNVTGGISDGSTGGETYVRDNIGHRTNKSASAGIGVGNNSTTVSHGLAETPVTGDIHVTPTGDMSTRGVTNFWIQNVTATTFDIKTNANVTGSTLFFAWVADAGGSH